MARAPRSPAGAEADEGHQHGDRTGSGGGGGGSGRSGNRTDSVDSLEAEGAASGSSGAGSSGRPGERSDSVDSLEVEGAASDSSGGGSSGRPGERSDSVGSLEAERAATAGSSGRSAAKLQDSGDLPSAGEQAAEVSEQPRPERAGSLPRRRRPRGAHAAAAEEGRLGRENAWLWRLLQASRARAEHAEKEKEVVRRYADTVADGLRQIAELHERLDFAGEGGASEGLKKQLEEQLGAGLRMSWEVAAELADLRLEVLSSHQECLQPKERDGASPQGSRSPRPAGEGTARQGGRRESELWPLAEQLDLSRSGRARAERELDAAKRSAGVRSEDLQRALASEKHARQAAGLLGPTPGSPTSGGSRTESNEADEAVCLKGQLSSTEQERSVLANTLEWKELEWRDWAEGARRDMQEMRAAHQGEVGRLESEIQAMEKAARGRPEAAAAAPPSKDRLPSALRWLLPGFRAPGPKGPGQPLCRDACWALLAAMPDTVALRCCAHDYTITEATKEAGRIWGSSTMLGRSVLALASAPSAAWLREAFGSHQGVVEQEKEMAGFPGFVVRYLGCEAFTSRKGETHDYNILAMSFPAETTHGGQAEIMVVLSLERGAGFAPMWLSQSTGPPSRALRSDQSEASSGRSAWQRSGVEPQPSEVSAVSPDDSVSNL